LLSAFMTSREEAAEAPRTLSPLRASTSRHTQYHPPSWPLDFTCGTRIPSITNKGTRGDDTAQVERTGKAYERVLLGTPCLLLVLGCFASALLSRHFLRPRGNRAVGGWPQLHRLITRFQTKVTPLKRVVTGTWWTGDGIPICSQGYLAAQVQEDNRRILLFGCPRPSPR